MSSPLVFATSNAVKFASAFTVANELGYKIVQNPLELTEIQSDNGEEIVTFKVEQAYKAVNSPVVVSDDTWIIPGLNGFPGPYMKYINDWFTAVDFLRLTLPLEDRRIILRQHVAYRDESGVHTFVGDINGVLLKEIRGSHKYAHTAITSLNDGQNSIAELIASNAPTILHLSDTVWHHFGDWYTARA